MVERDTGRSRGFGFVSYDNAASAAQAIQELNGYAVSNEGVMQLRLRWLTNPSPLF
jgi:RNA recognition motif-containing protein